MLCDRIEERLLLAHQERKPFTVPPILLVGLPGVGKSYAVRRLAQILGLPPSMLDMSSLQTNGRLHGAGKHWANATQGLLRELVIGGQVANPVVLLDEIDKTPLAGSSNRYDPLAPLHVALERGTDSCLRLGAPDARTRQGRRFRRGPGYQHSLLESANIGGT